MIHGPDFRIGGILRDVAARDLKPGDAFESSTTHRVLSVHVDEAKGQVTYHYEFYDYGVRLESSITDRLDEMHFVRRRPKPWSPLILVSIAARLGATSYFIRDRFHVFTRADQRGR